MTKPERIWHLVLVAFHWILLGFILGTLTLLGPVRWMTEATRRLQWTQNTENALVMGTILVLVVASFVAASVLVRIMSAVNRTVAAGLSLATIVGAAVTLGLWMNPVWVSAHMGTEVKANERFTFGPYPTEDRMPIIKSQGYTAIVSLLHPAVVPFEPKLLADEKVAAEKAGIELIHIPLLPWISDNEKELARLRQIVESPKGRYYIHCYLGKDRVMMARTIVERYSPAIDAVKVEKVRATELQTFRADASYERGMMYELEPEVFLVPFPTDEELLDIVGVARSVVSLMNPNDPADRPWVERERAVLTRWSMKLIEMPLLADDPAARAREIARAVKSLPRPVVVHSFLSPSTGRAPAAEAFKQAYLSAK